MFVRVHNKSLSECLFVAQEELNHYSNNVEPQFIGKSKNHTIVVFYYTEFEFLSFLLPSFLCFFRSFVSFLLFSFLFFTLFESSGALFGG